MLRGPFWFTLLACFLFYLFSLLVVIPSFSFGGFLQGRGACTKPFVIRRGFNSFLFSFYTFFFFMGLSGGAVSFTFMVGSNSFLVFFLAFGLWGASFVGGSPLKLRYALGHFLGGGVFLFDLFVVALRPLTLTLRIFINISLGHFVVLGLSSFFVG